MKTNFVLIYSFLSMTKVLGCDICGGTSLNNNSNLGYLNSLQKPFALISNQRVKFNSNLFDDQYQDNISTTQFQYNWIPRKRIILSAILTHKTLERNISGPNSHQFSYSEIGDCLFNVYFKLLDNRDSVFQFHKHVIYIGSSIKLPIAKYQIRDLTKQIIPLNLQPGNGSFGISLSTFYAYKNPKFGVNVNSKLTYFNENELNYQNGIQLNFSIGFFKPFRMKQMIIIPQIGLMFEHFQKDKEFGEIIQNSGNTFTITNSQIEIIYKKLILSSGYQIISHQQNLKIQQNMSNRLNLGIGWIF